MPTTLSEQLEQYKFRWSNATKRYAQTYPDKKVNGNSTQNDRAYQSVIQIANELLLFNSNLKGDIANSKTYINDADEKIQKVKKEHEEQKVELVSAVGNNKAAKPFKIDKNISKALNQISKINEKILGYNLFPLTLGGEHSITPGCIRPFVKKYKKLCLLHCDAHADLRDSYEGEKFSHASAIRRCLDNKNVSLISFGIRNISESEIPYLKKNSSRIKIFWAKDKKSWNLKKFKKIIKNKTVYLTFDVDGLDSSIMPATGTPEPGGLLWDETLEIIKIAAKHSKIVGADINELAPIKGFNSYNFLVAKLAYKILSYKFLYK